MTINVGQYCGLSEAKDAVIWGPRLLKQNEQTAVGIWRYNVNVVENWDDDSLRVEGFYPYALIDDGPPNPLPQKYTRSLGPFVITATQVEQTVVYTEFTQEQYDRTQDTTVKNSQRVAADLARQTLNLLNENTARNEGGNNPLIPANDLADVQSYLFDMYAAADDITGTLLPDEPPGATRQLTNVEGENEDRTIIRRNLVQFGGFDYWEIECTLYTDQDATGFSLWVQYQDGTYLFTLPLVDQGNGVWYVTTDKNGGMANRDDFSFAFFKGKLISQINDLPPGDDSAYPLAFDVKWLNGLTLQQQLGN